MSTAYPTHAEIMGAPAGQTHVRGEIDARLDAAVVSGLTPTCIVLSTSQQWALRYELEAAGIPLDTDFPYAMFFRRYRSLPIVDAAGPMGNTPEISIGIIP